MAKSAGPGGRGGAGEGTAVGAPVGVAVGIGVVHGCASMRSLPGIILPCLSVTGHIAGTHARFGV